MQKRERRRKKRKKGFKGMSKEEVFRSVDRHMRRSRKAQWLLR